MKIFRYRIPCTTDSTNEYVYLPEAEAAPTVCPVDTAHTIDSGNIVIDKTYDLDIQKTQPTVSQDDQSRADWGHFFSAPANQTTTENIPLPYTCALRGGEFKVTNAQFGDYFELDIVDADNVLGYGAGFVVKKYIRSYQVFSGLSTLQSLKDESISDPITDVLYIQVRYTAISTGITREFQINFFSYEG